MRFSLFPKNCCVSSRIGRLLSWFVMLFGIGVLITGILVRDVAPVGAQTPNAVPQETSDNAPAPQLNGTPENAAQSQSDAQPQSDTPAARIAEAAVQGTVNGAAGAVDNNQEIDAAANVQAESGTPAPEAAQIQAQAVDAAAPVVDAEEDLSTRYQMDTVEKAIGHKALIEQKKATDTTNVFSRIMSILGIFGFIGIAWLLSNNKNISNLFVCEHFRVCKFIFCQL